MKATHNIPHDIVRIELIRQKYKKKVTGKAVDRGLRKKKIKISTRDARKRRRRISLLNSFVTFYFFLCVVYIVGIVVIFLVAIHRGWIGSNKVGHHRVSLRIHQSTLAFASSQRGKRKRGLLLPSPPRKLSSLLQLQDGWDEERMVKDQFKTGTLLPSFSSLSHSHISIFLFNSCGSNWTL